MSMYATLEEALISFTSLKFNELKKRLISLFRYGLHETNLLVDKDLCRVNLYPVSAR